MGLDGLLAYIPTSQRWSGAWMAHGTTFRGGCYRLPSSYQAEWRSSAAAPLLLDAEFVGHPEKTTEVFRKPCAGCQGYPGGRAKTAPIVSKNYSPYDVKFFVDLRVPEVTANSGLPGRQHSDGSLFWNPISWRYETDTITSSGSQRKMPGKLT